MKFKKYCIDFDHTITINGKFPECGELRPHADRVIKRLKENGAEICIWTCRTGEHAEMAKEFLAKYDIPYDTFNDTLPSEKELWGSGGRKVYAECYIDDLSIHAQMCGGIDWLQIEEFLFGEPKYRLIEFLRSEGLSIIPPDKEDFLFMDEDTCNLVLCPMCEGTGVQHVGVEAHKCKYCNGNGEV